MPADQNPVYPPLALMLQHRNPATVLRHASAVPAQRPNDRDVDHAMWNGPVPLAERRNPPGFAPGRPPVIVDPTMMQAPESQDPNGHIWFNANCPPWTCPPFNSVATDLSMSHCVPWYEVDTLLSAPFSVHTGRIYIIKSCSYEALNAAQDDVFQITIMVNGVPMVTFEDSMADAAVVNPAQQYGLAGHFRPMPVGLIADHRSIVSVRARLRGAITLTGVSPHLPGDPITTGNCQMKVLLQGYLAVDRAGVEGGPRPTDLGDMDFIYLSDDQTGGGL